MKNILLLACGLSLSLISTTYAQLNIIPGGNEIQGKEIQDIVEDVVGSKENPIQGGDTIDRYYSKAKELDDKKEVGKQLASGVMTRDTILHYAAYLVRFISQLGLLIGAIMIIFAGYEYATFVFTGSQGKGSSKIRNAIMGVLVIVFSYAIMRIITTAFLT